MAKHLIQARYPYPVNWSRWTRNNMQVSAMFFSKIAGHLANVAQYRKKILFCHTQDFANIETGESGTQDRWRFRFRSGHGTTRVRFLMTMALDDHNSAVDPYVYWELTDVVATTSANSTELRYGVHTGTPNDTPDEWLTGWVIIDIKPDTEYTAVLKAVDYARPVSCLAYERGDRGGLDDTKTGAVDPTRYSVKEPILDEDIVQLAEAGTNLWKHNGSQLFAWSAEDTGATSPPQLTSTSYKTFIDDSTTAPTADAANGFNPQLTYHNTFTETDVPVEFAVYASHNDGGFGGSGSVRYNTGTDTIEITNITSAAWYKATGTLTANSAKGLVQGKVASPSGVSITLYAAHLCEYES